MSSIDYAGKAERVKQYLLPFFAAHANEHFLYHNLEHTKTVVAAAEQIGNHYQLNPKDLFIVTSAAWFHDSGYFIGKAIEHEQHGALFATSFLESEGLEESVITQIKNCILATKLPQNPTGLLEKIVCDSDLFHLGSDNFAERNRLIRKEAEAISGQKIEKSQWRKSTIALLTNHHYHTDYCQQLLNEKKEANLQQLLSKELEASVESTVLEQPLSTTLPGTSAKSTLTEIDTPISSIFYSGKEPKEKKKVEKKHGPTGELKRCSGSHPTTING